eukprot:m.196235 g.196235  ORF g.196235 m.196235 type:complete len:1264 (+) comp15696_c3_seq7:336-4127(+)
MEKQKQALRTARPHSSLQQPRARTPTNLPSPQYAMGGGISPPKKAICVCLARLLLEVQCPLSSSDMRQPMLGRAVETAINKAKKTTTSSLLNRHVFVSVLRNMMLDIRDGHEIIGEEQLSNIVCFGAGVTHAQCFGVLRRQSEKKIQCWVFQAENAEMADNHVRTLLKACEEANRPSITQATSPSPRSADSADMKKAAIAASVAKATSVSSLGTPVERTLTLSPDVPFPDVSIVINSPEESSTDDTPGPQKPSPGHLQLHTDHIRGARHRSASFGSLPSTTGKVETKKAYVHTQKLHGGVPSRLLGSSSRKPQYHSAGAVDVSPRLPNKFTSGNKPQPELQSRLRRVPTYMPNSMGCLIRAKYGGTIVSEKFSKNLYKTDQASLDAAVNSVLMQPTQDERDARRWVDCFLSVFSNNIVITSVSAHGQMVLLKLTRGAIKFCGNSTKNPGFFAWLSQSGDGQFLYYIFQASAEADSSKAVQALARVFCAGEKQDALLGTVSHKELSASHGNKKPIEIAKVQYLGHMELVGSDVQSMFARCGSLLLQQQKTHQGTVAVQSNMIEIIDPKIERVAKWFAFESIDCVTIVEKNVCLLIVTRGILPLARYFCYALKCSTEKKAHQMKSIIIAGLHSWRREAISKLTESEGILSLMEDGYEDRVRDILQRELDSMNEDYRSHIMKRYRLQSLHLQSEKEQNRAMLSLIAGLYTSNKSKEVLKGRTGGLFSTKPSAPGLSLANSLTNLVKDKEQAPVKQSPLRFSPKFSSKSERRPDTSESKPWRQALFQSLTAKAPRAETPGRQSSSLFLTRRPTKLQFTTDEQSRSEIVRARWRKAVQQQLMLIRMAKQNSRLEMETQLHASKRANSKEFNKINEIWAPLWKVSPATWQYNQLNACIRAGVIPEERGAMWIAMVKRQESNSKIPRMKYLDLLLEPCIYRPAIRLDLGRTFPEDPLFAETGGSGQTSLYNLMAAYSVLDEDVGYCQGLSFLGGLFLSQMNEEDAFQSLVTCMFMHEIRHQYAPDMSALQVQLYQLSRMLHDHSPRVFEKLAGQNVEMFLFATPWLLTCFSSNFPKDFCLRVLDFVMLDGKIVLLKISCALLMSFEKEILELEDFEKTLVFLQKDIAKSIERLNPLKLLDSVPVTEKQVQAYANEFHIMKEQIPGKFMDNKEAVDECSHLIDRLMDADHENLSLKGELEVMQQQLNHAKGALSDMSIELEQTKKKLAEREAELSEISTERLQSSWTSVSSSNQEYNADEKRNSEVSSSTI